MQDDPIQDSLSYKSISTVTEPTKASCSQIFLLSAKVNYIKGVPLIKKNIKGVPPTKCQVLHTSHNSFTRSKATTSHSLSKQILTATTTQ